jgi:hypothetical protein
MTALPKDLRKKRDGFQTLPSGASPRPTSTTSLRPNRAGATISRVAADFGIHRTTVADHLDRHGVARHHDRTAWDDGDVEEAA